jgi:hypothetical protein
MGTTRRQTASQPEVLNVTPAAAEQSTVPVEVSKMDMVRQALNAGKDGLGDIITFIKEKFNVELAKDLVSSYKSTIKTGNGTGTKRSVSHAPTLDDLLAVKAWLKQEGLNVEQFLAQAAKVIALIEKVGSLDNLKAILKALQDLVG